MALTELQIRRDIAANFTLANPTLLSGEPAVETDTGKRKIGDGVTAWISLGYTAAAGLFSATTTVSTSGATAPTSGQVLTATGSASATWQTPASVGSASSGSVAIALATASVTPVTVKNALPPTVGQVLTATSASVANWQTPASVSPTITLGTQSGTSYTFALGDAGTEVEFTSSSAIALTVPTNASVAFPTGTPINFRQQGTGQITVAGASGVTVNSSNGLKSRAQYSTLSLIKDGTNTWVLSGDSST